MAVGAAAFADCAGDGFDGGDDEESVRAGGEAGFAEVAGEGWGGEGGG